MVKTKKNKEQIVGLSIIVGAIVFLVTIIFLLVAGRTKSVIPSDFILESDVETGSDEERGVAFVRFKTDENLGNLVTYYRQHLEKRGWIIETDLSPAEGYHRFYASNNKSSINIWLEDTRPGSLNSKKIVIINLLPSLPDPANNI